MMRVHALCVTQLLSVNFFTTVMAVFDFFKKKIKQLLYFSHSISTSYGMGMFNSCCLQLFVETEKGNENEEKQKQNKKNKNKIENKKKRTVPVIYGHVNVKVRVLSLRLLCTHKDTSIQLKKKEKV